MEIKIKFRTPFWSGNIDKETKKIRESTFLGSLRWWTEAVLRSLGYFVCDPTDKFNRCPKNDKDYCLSCLIFGATGLRRMFRIEIEGGNPVYEGIVKILPDERTHGWNLGGGIAEENIILKIISLNKDFDIDLIYYPLYLASYWGGIGAKTQLGFGVFDIIGENYSQEREKELLSSFNRAAKTLFEKGRVEKKYFKLRSNQNKEGIYPNLNDFFFLKYRFCASENDWWKKVNGIRACELKKRDGLINNTKIKDMLKNNYIPIAPAVKNWLRYGNGTFVWRNNFSNKKLEFFLFGTINKCPYCLGELIKGKCSVCKKKIDNSEVLKNASKISISHAYCLEENSWEFRIWGYIPSCKITEKLNKENLSERLVSGFKENGIKNIFDSKIMDFSIEKRNNISFLEVNK